MTVDVVYVKLVTEGLSVCLLGDKYWPHEAGGSRLKQGWYWAPVRTMLA